MPPKMAKEALILIINIGVTCPDVKVTPSSLEKAKQVAKRRIEKMIFLRPKDEVAIIIMGSSSTKNSLNSEHIEEFTDFQVPNWDLVQKVIMLQSTTYCSNWVEALEIGIEFMKENVIDASSKKIILMSDFNEGIDIVSQFQADVIADRLSDAKIDLITVADQLLDCRPTTSLKSSEALLKEVHEKINGKHISFDDALASLKFYIAAPARPCPYKYTLELVDKKIPIVSYVKTDEKKFPAWQKAKGDLKVQTKRQYLDRQRNTYEKDEITAGYKYGGTFIPVKMEQETDMIYKSGPKSYRIYGFTDRNDISLEYLYDTNTHVILPSSSAQSITKPFYSLVQALHETNSVAIARKVFRENSAPRMVALFPCIDLPDEPWCLVEIALAFAEDRRIMETRPMKSIVKQLTGEQNEAVDSLIDSLMLPETQDSYEVDGTQCFLPGCVPDPAAQHRWHMLSYRALNPDSPLPPMEDYLKDLLEAPLIKERSKANVQNIAKLFRLENIDPKAKEKDEIEGAANVHIDNNTDLKQSNKIEDKDDVESDLYKDSVLSLDTSDIDLDELVLSRGTARISPSSQKTCFCVA